MSRIDKIVGMDDEVKREERAPLWKRALWHALKVLVRRHPGAAASAAGAGAGYMVKGAVTESAEVVRDKAQDLKEALTAEQPSKTQSLENPTPPAEQPSNTQRSENSPAVTAEQPSNPPQNPTPLSPAPAPPREFSREEKRELLESLSEEQRRELAQLARSGE